MKVSHVADGEERKTVKFKSQSHVDHVLLCGGYRSHRLLKGPDHQSASLQGDPVAYASLIAGEEASVMTGEIVAASPRQCTCSLSPENPVIPAEKNIAVQEQPSYSSHLIPCDFFLFPDAQSAGTAEYTDYFSVEG